tara:strand:- start:14 stop:268 length:255 start_codon:yes stop_codon:yes gene_type:complete
VRTGKIFNVITGEETTVEEPDVVVSAEEHLKALRIERDKRIGLTDVWALSDRTMTQAQIDYRQALRDITKTATSLDDVTWPTKP